MAKFVVKEAKREQIYPKIALMAPSGGGKTYSSLRLATGMCDYIRKHEDREPRILFANTEAKRGYYYANEFKYHIVDLNPPHNPENYVDLIEYAVEEKYDILIIDSSSHEWDGIGGCLDLHAQAGGKYQDWKKVSPRHERFINAIAYSPITIIATMRSKDAYEMSRDNNGRTSVEKIGVGAKQREGFEYEFTATFLIDQKTNTAVAQKDNTHIFENDGAIILTEKHGERVMQWANSGDGYTPINFKDSISPEDAEKKELNDVINELKDICSDATRVKKIVTATVLNNKIAELNDGVKNFTKNTDLEKTIKLKEDVVEFLNTVK